MPGQELLNWGFETAGAGGADVFGDWTETASDGAIAQDAVVFRAASGLGAKSCKLTAGAGKNTLVKQQLTPAYPDLMYRLVIWSKGDGVTGGRVAVTSADEGTILTNGGASYTLPAAAEWTETTLPFLPGAEAHVHVTLTCPDLNGGIVYFDDMTLEQYCPWGHA